VAPGRAEIPYRSQYSSRCESGASTREEHLRWSRCGCGMACLQMILAARGDRVPPLVELGLRCSRYGGYEMRPARGYGPLIYAGFVAFAAAELGIEARVAAPLELGELIAAVHGDEVVLASVSVEIRDLVPAPARRGGHLVLVIDADADGARLCFHDPSGERAAWLGAADFERFYAGRGIAVTLPRG